MFLTFVLTYRMITRFMLMLLKTLWKDVNKIDLCCTYKFMSKLCSL